MSISSSVQIYSSHDRPSNRTNKNSRFSEKYHEDRSGRRTGNVETWNGKNDRLTRRFSRDRTAASWRPRLLAEQRSVRNWRNRGFSICMLEYRMTKCRKSPVLVSFCFARFNTAYCALACGYSRVPPSILNRPTYRVFKRFKR